MIWDADDNLVTTPLVFAIIVAAASQFLVGYNTGVMNAPEKVVFPGHSTGSWSLEWGAIGSSLAAAGGAVAAANAGNDSHC